MSRFIIHPRKKKKKLKEDTMNFECFRQVHMLNLYILFLIYINSQEH